MCTDGRLLLIRYYIQNNLVGLTILSSIFYFFSRQKREGNREDVLFLLLIVANFLLMMLELAIDLTLLGLSYRPKGLFLSIISVVFYILNPVPGMLYVLYIHQQVVGSRPRLSKLRLLLLIPFICNMLLSIMSPWTGWLFFISDEALYQRGNYFYLMVITNYFYYMVGLLSLLSVRDSMQRKMYSALLFFPLPVAIAGWVQTLFFGVEVLWLCLSLSLLVLFFNVEATQISRDYLTGVYNRRYFQHTVEQLYFRKRALNTTWALILDVNHFKSINDTYGHTKGDLALIALAQQLEYAFPHHAMVCRYGGDEFAVLLFQQTESSVKRYLEGLKQALELFNGEHHLPFSLSVSLGCTCMHTNGHESVEDFLHFLDLKMYQAKALSRDKQGDIITIICD